MFILLVNIASGQNSSGINYPQGYFNWPVKAKVGIVANFGELRPNHYHMGLDCRTDQRENMPVIASAAGYIAKIKIELFGFGRAIYINHPNGFTTLYAHLNDFNPALEKYVTEQQYKLKSWALFIDIPKNLFLVKQGELIAYSGSTGGSQGPHVHFEIRETATDKVLNPMLFGMPIPDNVAPDIFRLAVYDRTKSTYEQTPKIYAVKKINGSYSTAVPIKINTDKVSFAITAYDRNNSSSNQNGIFEGDLFYDSNEIVNFKLNNISYDETRYLNAHIDYRLKATKGPYVQHLSQLPGYVNGIYKPINGDGVISIPDNIIHQVKALVKDANGNVSTLNFPIQNTGITSVKSNTSASTQKIFYPNYVNVFENENVSFYLPEQALYDTVYFKFAEQKTSSFSIFQLHNTTVPVQTYFPVKIKATTAYPDKMVMHRFAGGKNDYDKATPEKGWYKSSFREFGNFQLMIDTVPPGIVPIGFKNGMDCSRSSVIKFSVTDNTENLDLVATLDGNWLRFSNDKGKIFVYKFDAYCTAGSHELKIKATDQVGNTSEKTYQFNR